MELTTGWNFDLMADRAMAERYIRENKPTFVIGSPMCTIFSQLQAFSKETGTKDYEEKVKKAERAPELFAQIQTRGAEGGVGALGGDAT